MFFSKIRFRDAARKKLVSHRKNFPASIKDIVYSMVLEPDENRGDCHFVYRFDGDQLPPVVTMVSERRPTSDDNQFECLTKEYDPSVREGQTLRIRSRVNATRKHNGDRRDIVQLMKWKAHDQGLDLDALPQRLTMAQEAGQRWLSDQGERCGFEVEKMAVSDYGRYEDFHTHIPAIAYLDMQAIIEVTDPGKVRDLLFQGFGKAKGFGFGLVEAMPYNTQQGELR